MTLGARMARRDQRGLRRPEAGAGRAREAFRRRPARERRPAPRPGWHRQEHPAAGAQPPRPRGRLDSGAVEGRDLPPVPDALEAALAPARAAERPLLLIDTYGNASPPSGLPAPRPLAVASDRAIVVIAGRGAPDRAGSTVAGRPRDGAGAGPASRTRRTSCSPCMACAAAAPTTWWPGRRGRRCPEPGRRRGRARPRLLARGGEGVAELVRTLVAARRLGARRATPRRARRGLHRPRDHRRHP